MSKSRVLITYSDGYVEEKPMNTAIFGLKRNGECPVLIEISGHFTISQYRRFKLGVCPAKGKVIVKHS